MPDDSSRVNPGRWRTVLFFGLLSAIVLWNGLLIGVPWFAGRGFESRPVVALSAGVYLTAGAVCHQQPARSFHPWGVQMPVCARCAGLYLGAAFGTLLCLPRRRPGGLLWLFPRRRSSGHQETLHSTRGKVSTVVGCVPAVDRRWAASGRDTILARWVVGLAAVPSAFTLVGEWSGLVDESAMWRALAGVRLGTAVAWVVSLVILGELE